MHSHRPEWHTGNIPWLFATPAARSFSSGMFGFSFLNLFLTLLMDKMLVPFGLNYHFGSRITLR
jgi:hypothetical protein